MNPNSLCEGIIKMIDEHEKYESYLKKNNYGNEVQINDYYEVMES